MENFIIQMAAKLRAEFKTNDPLKIDEAVKGTEFEAALSAEAPRQRTAVLAAVMWGEEK